MSTPHDQQPIGRTIGRRVARDGRPLTPDDRAALARARAMRGSGQAATLTAAIYSKLRHGRDRSEVRVQV